MTDSVPPSPDRFFAGVQGYLQSAALKGAVDLELFTHIAAGATTAHTLAEACAATDRGVRMLCDYLCVHGYLEKTDTGEYALPPDSAVFLDKASPHYLGSVTEFLLSDFFIGDIGDVAAAVRKGGVVTSPKGSDEPGHAMWVDFARAMTGLQSLPAAFLVEHVTLPAGGPARILDIAAGPGCFGIELLRRHPEATVTALDWENVLAVTRENAAAAGVADRLRTLPGSAFEVDFGGPYDAVLVPNFLHHFDMETNVNFLRRAGAAMAASGRLYVVEFAPDDDRVSPPRPASFAMQMLRQTEAGDAYTVAELSGMLRDAGFEVDGVHAPEGAPFTVVAARH